MLDEIYADYQQLDSINFTVITSQLQWLPLFNDDLYLGMQAMNIGIVDTTLTQEEIGLLQEYIKIERTPTEYALTVSAMSQLWIFGLYEVLRLWRERRYEFDKLYKNGGISSKLAHWEKSEDENLTTAIRSRQLKKYEEDESYRANINGVWSKIEKVYRLVELFRMNLAKHCAPGKNNAIPRAPGYGRINMQCGSLDYELITKDKSYAYLNRRNIADKLRQAILDSSEYRNF
ncbi:hypothetical protein D0S45_17980 [Marinifilum sp. JC120]|nr:hypothetical protein D0S45_17980 [Marinifilum sp. JC120]